MARSYRVAAASAAIAALACSTLAIGAVSAGAADPNTLTYVNRTASVSDAVATVTQILSSGTTVGGKTWQGTPDGMGGVRNADGTITVFVNHELSAADAFVAKTEQSYGGFGATISAVTFDPTTGTITKVADAIKSATWYDYINGSYGDTAVAPEEAPDSDAFSTPNHTNNLNRFCSAYLAPAGSLATTVREKVKYFVTKTVNGKKVKVAKYKFVSSAYGIKDPVFITGEEGSDESRAFALNTRTGNLAQLPALGLGAWENVILAPSSATKKTTIALLGEDGDSKDSQLFLYKGTKTKSGAWYERAGLTNGQSMVAKVFDSGTGLATDLDARTSLAKVNVSSIVRGQGAVSATKIAVSGGQATITVPNAKGFKVGDIVTLAGFGSVTDATPVTINFGAGDSNINGENIVTAATASTITVGVDADNLAETAIAAGTVTLSSSTVVVTTGAAHKLNEGDYVNFEGVTGAALAGKYLVTGAPSTTVFTVEAEGAALDLTGGKVNKLLTVGFRKVPTNLSGDAQQVIAKLRGTVFARVEDGNFDPTNANVYYFVTTQSDSDIAGNGAPGVKEVGRDGGALWKMTFEDVAKPELGATLELVLDGTEAPVNDPSVKLNKPDNFTVSIDGRYILLQEDPGANAHLSRILALRLSDKKLVSVAQFNNDLFNPSNVDNFITNDEESSGIFDATTLFNKNDGAAYFVFNAQIHPVSKDANNTGTALGTDPLKARAAGILRPDLIAQTSRVITKVNHANAEATSITITVADIDGDDDLKGLSINDTVSLFGTTTDTAGHYAVTGVNEDANTFTVKVKAFAATGDLTLLGSNPRAVTTDVDPELALKDTIVEGGALYTLKISDWDALFSTVPLV